MGIQLILAVGLFSIFIGFTALFLMVKYDLGPLSRLNSRQRWVLGLALGTGVCAFTIKLAIITTLSLSLKPSNAVPQDMSYYTKSDDGVVWYPLPLEAPSPANNPMTPEKIALGDRLFHDRLLSPDGKLSCASCHDTGSGSGIDGHRRVAVGIMDQIGPRNVPTVFNSAFQSVMFWDGRASSLEEQALGPLLNPIEMGNPNVEGVIERIKSNPSYISEFESVFGKGVPITGKKLAQAIAAYERTLITPDTPYDRFVRGDKTALTEQQIKGMQLFEKVGCVSCHSGPNFSAASVLSAGKGKSGWRPFPSRHSLFEEKYFLTKDKGQSRLTRGAGVWRVASLRNVAVTGPYFHNGSVDDLSEAVRIMAEVQLGRVVTDKDHLDPVTYWNSDDRKFVSISQTPIKQEEIDSIVAFLKALTSDRFKDQLH